VAIASWITSYDRTYISSTLKPPQTLDDNTLAMTSCRNDAHTGSQGPSNYEITKSYGGYHNFLRSFNLKPGQEDEAAEILDAFKKADIEAAASSDDAQSDAYHASSQGYEDGSDDDDGSSISSHYSSGRMSDCSEEDSCSVCPDSPSAGSTAIFEEHQYSTQSDGYDSDNDDLERLLEGEGVCSDEGDESDPEDDLDDLDCCDDEDDDSDAHDDIDSDPSDDCSEASDDFD
jgi:hypothetical protein